MPVPIELNYLDYPAVVDIVNGRELYFPPELLSVLPKRLQRERWEYVTSQDAVLKVRFLILKTLKSFLGECCGSSTKIVPNIGFFGSFAFE